MFESVDHEVGTAAAVLDAVRSDRAAADAAEARLLSHACDWADLHPAESIDDAAVLVRGGDSAVAIAGEGAPLVAEFAIAEYAAALRVPTRIGRERMGQALELRHRLPRVWKRVMGGDLPAWRGRRVAEQTMGLTLEAAAYVDAQISSFAHRIGLAETERLIADATCRFMPAVAEELRRDAMDGRHVLIGTQTVSFMGTTFVQAEMDLADALDLEAALSTGAASLAEAGSAESLDVRRSLALGDLARGDQPLPVVEPSGGRAASSTPVVEQGRQARRRDLTRQVILHVHIAPDAETARVEAGGSKHLLTAEQIRTWCRAPHAHVTVKPVIDLNAHLRVDAYEIPERLHDQIHERDGTCVFPWCTRTARACDTDHITAYDEGGPTATANLGSLCRHHHRLKTHAGWTYTMLEPGSYLWRSPHGMSFVRDGTGTQDVSRDLSRPPPRRS